MKHIISFKIFESNESDNFIVTKDTTLDDFTSYLDRRLDSHSVYGNGETFENEVKRVIENTLKSEGMSEQQIMGEIEKFYRNLDEDTEMISDEYDEYETSFEGTNRYKNKVVFEWSAAGDLYHFGGNLKDLSEMLKDIKGLLA